MTYDLHNAGNNNNIAPSKTLSTPNNNHISSEMAVSVSNLTLTAEIFNNNNKTLLPCHHINVEEFTRRS